jgi:hypothetical protein
MRTKDKQNPNVLFELTSNGSSLMRAAKQKAAVLRTEGCWSLIRLIIGPIKNKIYGTIKNSISFTTSLNKSKEKYSNVRICFFNPIYLILQKENEENRF